MEATRCKSCGGVLQKVSDHEYRCAFCGTAHRLTLDDPRSVDALMDQNNQRWLSINRGMEQFFAAINRAAGHQEKYNGHRSRTLGFGLAGFAVVAILFLATHMPAAPGVTIPSASEIASIGSFWATLVVVVVAVSLLLGWTERRVRDRELAAAQSLLWDVLANYRKMSTRPASELLATLHNANMLATGSAEVMASRIYVQVIAREQSPQA